MPGLPRQPARRTATAADRPIWAVPRRDVIDRADAIRVAVVTTLAVVALIAQARSEGISPTGSRPTDAIVVALFAAIVVWAGGSAPWWAVTALGLIATVAGSPSRWTFAALAALLIGVALGAKRHHLPWLRASAAALALLGLMRATVNPFFGASAIVVGVSCVVFSLVAISHRSRPVRRRAGWCAAAGAMSVVLASAGLGVAGLQADDDLELGRDRVLDGLDELRDGDTDAAAVSFAEGAEALRRASDAIDAPWSRPSALVPVVAQHRSMIDDIVQGAAEAAATAADALAVADFDRLQVADGTVDVDAFAQLAGPLGDLDEAVGQMSATLRDVDSPWLAGAVRDELERGLDDLGDAMIQTRAIAAAAEHGPAMLGNDGTRTYLIAFTSPGEARGQSGTMSNWAEIEITDGIIRETAVGRISDLVEGITEPGRSESEPSDLILDVPEEYFERYEPFGAGSAETPVLPSYWSNVTMSPDTPTVATVMAQMYRAARGTELDGVFVIDPTGLATLLELAGPVTVPGLDQPITAATLEQYLLFDQYQLEESIRREALEAVAGLTVRQFLTTTLPEPARLAEVLGPAVTEGHLVGWAARPEESELFRLIGMAGDLPGPDGRDGLAVVTDNTAGNEIDSFLQRTVAYTASYDEDSGRVDGEIVVTLHNASPVSAYPESVIGNTAGLPVGTNQSLLTVFTPLDVVSTTVDDRPATVTAGSDREWNTSTVQVEIPAGRSVTVRFSVTGTLASGRYQLAWRPQPLALPDAVTIDVASPDGTSVATASGALPRLSLIDSEGVSALR